VILYTYYIKSLSGTNAGFVKAKNLLDATTKAINENFKNHYPKYFQPFTMDIREGQHSWMFTQ